MECKIPTTGVVSICWSELFHGNKHCPPPAVLFLSFSKVSRWKQLKMLLKTADCNFLKHHCWNLYLQCSDTVKGDKAWSYSRREKREMFTHTHKATRTITLKPLTQHVSTLTVCYCRLVLALLHKETLHRRCSGPHWGNAIISALRWRATASRWLLARLMCRQSADTVQDKLNKQKRNWTKSRRFENGFASCSNNYKKKKKLGLYQWHEWRGAPLLEATQSSEHRK